MTNTLCNRVMGKGIEHQVSHSATENIERVYLFRKKMVGCMYVVGSQGQAGLETVSLFPSSEFQVHVIPDLDLYFLLKIFILVLWACV